MPTCQAYKCMNTTAQEERQKVKVFSRYLNLKMQQNEKERSNGYTISVWDRMGVDIIKV